MSATIPSQVKLARAATETLRDELAALTPEEWETPNACGDWTVAEVAAHLARAGETYASYVRRALEGITDPPEGGSGPITERGPASESILRRTREYRRGLGDRVLEAFERNGLGLVELFESLRPDDWQRPAFHPVAVIPVHQLLGWRIAELSLHRWDILNRLGRVASLPDGSHEPIVDWLPNWLKVAFNPGPAMDEPRRYLFVLGRPLLRTMKLHVYGDRFVVDPEMDDSSADAVLTTHPETFILLMMGRLKWESALADEAVAVGGSRVAAAALPRWFGAL